MKARLQQVTVIGGVLQARIVRAQVVAVLPVKRTRFLADVADFTPERQRRFPVADDGPVADDERSRLHQIVDELPSDELVVARQLLDLLAKGLAAPRGTVIPNASDADEVDDGDDDEDVADDPLSSPETIAKLTQLSDQELLRLDELLESDRAGARAFWRQRFGEELPDDELVEDGSG